MTLSRCVPLTPPITSSSRWQAANFHLRGPGAGGHREPQHRPERPRSAQLGPYSPLAPFPTHDQRQERRGRRRTGILPRGPKRGWPPLERSGGGGAGGGKGEGSIQRGPGRGAGKGGGNGGGSGGRWDARSEG